MQGVGHVGHPWIVWDGPGIPVYVTLGFGHSALDIPWIALYTYTSYRYLRHSLRAQCVGYLRTIVSGNSPVPRLLRKSITNVGLSTGPHSQCDQSDDSNCYKYYSTCKVCARFI